MGRQVRKVRPVGEEVGGMRDDLLKPREEERVSLLVLWLVSAAVLVLFAVTTCTVLVLWMLLGMAIWSGDGVPAAWEWLWS